MHPRQIGHNDIQNKKPESFKFIRFYFQERNKNGLKASIVNRWEDPWVTYQQLYHLNVTPAAL